MPDTAAVEAAILELTLARGSDKSICPSEAARRLHPEPEGWQSLLGPVRQAAIRLSRAGRIDILRKGKPVPPEAAHGVIRLRAKPPAEEGAA